VPSEGKSIGEEKEVEESRGGRSGAHGQTTRSAARGIEEEFVGGSEEEGEVVLWTDSATRRGIVGVGVARPRGCHHVLEVPKMWQRRVLYGRQLGARSAPLLEEREDKLV